MPEAPTTLPLPRPTTELCAVLLHPAGHTRSPAMHNAAFSALGIDAIFMAFDVPPDALGDALAGIRALGVRQLAISLPHKQAIGAYCDELDETAQAIGAVNTVTRVGDRLVGANTDWIGAVRALEREGPLEGANAVVLGAGGTARAVTFGLLRRGVRVTVLNRTEATAARLAKELGAHASGGLDALADVEHDVLVNTTSAGLREERSPVPAGALRPGSRVLDAVYDPAETRLLRDARARGATPIGGKWMLVLQAVEQIRLWSGKTPPGELLAAAFDQAT
ncbi:MAG: shikimate dehydrogenase [bacterium]|nr:shikimate dehydrogenase [bacterium]